MKSEPCKVSRHVFAGHQLFAPAFVDGGCLSMQESISSASVLPT
jgi:hypothetical protein